MLLGMVGVIGVTNIGRFEDLFKQFAGALLMGLTALDIVPDFVVILLWNIAVEVRQQNVNLGGQGRLFVT